MQYIPLRDIIDFQQYNSFLEHILKHKISKKKKIKFCFDLFKDHILQMMLIHYQAFLF